MAIATGTLLVAGTMAAGCAESEQQVEEDAPAVAPAQTTESAPASPPDTTAEALWAHLEEEDYRESWSLWPGTDRLYEGTEPHGMLLTTYANEIALEALRAGAVEDLPPGSIIVKENYMPDSTFDAATVMFKVDAYNTEHQDWLFAKYNAEGTPDAFGRAPMCQACHQQAPSGYVYTEVPR
ncbi:MAG TPA: cytochrome P460 family protein [Longimicrobiales bacterium]|nr:cytochrome P460 family protein [Longimicrobiales bacterium]